MAQLNLSHQNLISVARWPLGRLRALQAASRALSLTLGFRVWGVSAAWQQKFECMDGATTHLKGVKVAAYHGGCGCAAS